MRSKTPLALMEQILMILVFALAAAVCLRMFVYADRLSRRNEAVSQAAVYAQNTAEMIKECGEPLSEQLKNEDGWVQKTGTWIKCFDTDWQPIKQEISPSEDKTTAIGETGEYQITVYEAESEIHGLLRAKIVVSWGNEELFQIPVAWQEVNRHE